MKNDGSIYTLLFLVSSCAVVFFLLWVTVERSSLLTDLMGDTDPPKEHGAERIALPSPPASGAEIKKPTDSKPRPVEKYEGSKKVYKWIDKNGTIHFSDRPQHSDRKSVMIVPSSEETPNRTQHKTGQEVASLKDKISQLPKKQSRSIWAKKISRGQFVTSEGYEITTYAQHLGKKLIFSGRVEGGPECSTLTLAGYLENRDGDRVRLTAQASDVGSLGKLFESRPARVPWIKKGWDVERLSASCSER